jgi:UDP-2,4-diacetamido-2,4,6-trideoxy-beta-L-altropyranose hydrolase
MTLDTLWFRVDSTVTMGSGHVMRCLALAQAWNDSGGSSRFAMAQGTPAVTARLCSEGIPVLEMSSAPGSENDAKELIAAARADSGPWVVVDGYHFNSEYLQVLKGAGLQLLLVDDTAQRPDYPVRIILNQNPHADRSLYRRRDAGSRLLLGPRYAMLRREFKAWRDFRREIPPQGRKVLITMGGSDPANVTPRVIKSLEKIPGLEIQVVVGGDNSRLQELRDAGLHSLSSLTFLTDVKNMPELMAWADVAISAAGSTCWEMCLLGLPAIVIDVASNQTPVAQELARRGAAVHVGSASSVSCQELAAALQELLLSQNARAMMSRRQQLLVDGRGVERIMQALQSATLTLRKVEERDCHLLWEWANDPAVRRVSFSPDPIPWEQHVKWFYSKLADPNTRHYVAQDGQEVPVGQARYQLDGARAVMSINLAPGLRGRGFGSAILELATDQLFHGTNVHAIYAYVKPENEPSVQLFLNAGFMRQATVSMQGQQAIHFVLERSSGW